MGVTVSHALSATTPDDPAYEIKPSNWNSNHAITFAQNWQATGNTTQSTSGSGDGMFISGVGLASVGVSNNSLIISVPAGAPSPVNFSAGTTSNDLPSVVFSNSNGVSFGLNGSTITASHNGLTSQSNQAFSAVGGSSTFQTLSFANANGVTFSNIAGSVLASYTRNAASNAIASVGSATNSGTNTSRFAADDHVHAGVFSVGVSTGGNTVGDTRVDVGRFVFQGGNNVTLSQITAANALNTIVISGGAAGGAVVSNAIQSVGSATGSGTNTSRFAADDHVHAGVFSVGVSTAGNTVGDTRVDVGRFVLQGGNNVTLSQITAAGALNTIVISGGAAGGADGINALVVNGGVSTVSTTLTLSNSNNITFGHAAGVITASASFVAQTNQTGGIYVTAQSTGQSSSSTYDLRTLSFVPDGIISAGWSNGSFRVSATQSNQAFSADASSTFQTLSFQNSNGFTFSNNAGAIRASYTVPVVSNAIQSVGSATGSGTNTSRFAADDHVHAGVFSVGVSTGGNTGGDTRVDVGRFVFAGGNNVTLSQATAAGGLNTISIHGGAGGAGETRASVYAVSNTTQSTSGTIPLSQFSFHGAGVASVGVSNGSVVISVPAGGGGQTLTQFLPYGLEAGVAVAWTNALPHVHPMVLHNAVALDRVVTPLRYTQATNSTLTVTVSYWHFLYTKNDSTLSSAHSISSIFTVNGSGTASSQENSGLRLWTWPWTTTIPAGEYYVGQMFRSSTSGADASLSMIRMSSMNTSVSGLMGVASNVSAQRYLGLGEYSVSSTVMPNSLGFTELRGTDTRALRPHHFHYVNGTV